MKELHQDLRHSEATKEGIREASEVKPVLIPSIMDGVSRVEMVERGMKTLFKQLILKLSKCLYVSNE